MNSWTIKEDQWIEENITANGNKFLIGNGYMGIRGTLDEYKKDQFVAINLAGTYDQVGDAWREPLNAPNALYTYIKSEEEEICLPEGKTKNHEISLNYRYGMFSRVTEFETASGTITVTSERFISMSHKHLIAMKYQVKADFSGNLSIVTGIDGDVWDLNGPHYDEISFQNRQGRSGEYLEAAAITHENKDIVYVMETVDTDEDYPCTVEQQNKKLLRTIQISAQKGKTYCIYKYISIYTSKDSKEYSDLAKEVLEEAVQKGYQQLEKEHKTEWERLWKYSEILIEGDEEAMEALNYSSYHLHSIAPRHSESLSIAARGLSGQTYKGAVFWDTEMFMLDFFLHTEPEVAKTLLKYRIETLPGAIKKASDYGFKGAFYAWESQEGGYDACSDYNVVDVFTKRPMRTFFKDKQIHISSAVVYGIMSYTNYTNDRSLLEEGGFNVIMECASFYYDLLVKKVHLEHYELHDVVGPDEYHERVNNNGYTNRMAKFTFESATGLLHDLPQFSERLQRQISDAYDVGTLEYNFKDAAEKIYIPKPKKDTEVIEQFDGYFQLEDATIEEVRSRLLDDREYWGGAYGVASHTKVIKQADVVTWLTLFPNDYNGEVLQRNWDYYEPRTEHGSSLSACMYALLACRLNMPDNAYPFFMKSAKSDLSGKGKEWAGLIYIGGTHPASAGGSYMTAIKGFGGVTVENNKIRAIPNLPSHWSKMKFHVIHQGIAYEVEAEKDSAKITELPVI